MYKNITYNNMRNYQIDITDKDDNDIDTIYSEVIPRIWDDILLYEKEDDSKEKWNWPFKVTEVQIAYKRYPRIEHTVIQVSVVIDLFS